VWRAPHRSVLLGALALLWAIPARGGEVEIVGVELLQRAPGWTVRVTLRHDDTGWDHYADAWRLVTEAGEVLATRELRHPHVDEQPFTRSLEGLAIREGTAVVYVEARDSVHGWTPAATRVRVDLGRTSGDRYRIER
jgi:hypothetical protein